MMRIGWDEPLRTVFKYVDQHRDDNDSTDYELRTVFPIINFVRSETRTLRELGLFPKRALTMHVLEGDSSISSDSSIQVKKIARAGDYVDSDSEFNF